MEKHPLHTVITRSWNGALAGVAATAVMSAVMGLAKAGGLMERQPPPMIVESFFPEWDEPTRNAAAVLSHFGYGAGSGAVYGLVCAPKNRNARTGALYGALVWAAGYEGWLPLVNILPPAHHDGRGRAFTMFTAHIIYGSVLGMASRPKTPQQ